MSEIDKTLEANLPLISELAALAQQLAATGRVSIGISELAKRLGQSVGTIISVFEQLGLKPRTWDNPSGYVVADVLEASTRHEVGNRANR